MVHPQESPGELSLDRARLQHLLTKVIAHDLNNVFTIAQSYVDLTLRLVPPRPQEEEFLKRALRAIRRGVRLNEILHTISADEHLPAEECSLEELMEALHPVLDRLYAEGPSWRIQVAEDLPLLHTHHVSLTRFLVDLSANAFLRWNHGDELLLHIAPTAENAPKKGVLLYAGPSPGVPALINDDFKLFLTPHLSSVLASDSVEITITDDSIVAILPSI